jgi:membrane protein implicated in regulation of membrane protease activity
MLGRLAVAVVVLFLIAAAFNDHSSTSIDGIIWWVAIAGFALLIVASCAVLVGFLFNRGKRTRRSRTR